MIIIFSSQDVCFPSFFVAQNQDEGRNIKKGNWERQFSGNGKLQIYFKAFSNERNTNKFSLPTERTYLHLIKINLKRGS